MTKNAKNQKAKDKYWKKDNATDIAEYEKTLEKKFVEYQEYAKEIERTKLATDDKVDLTPEEI